MKSGFVLAALVALGSASSAQAGPQTFEFTAVLNQLGSYKDLTWSDSGEGIVAGSIVRKGDLIKGRVTFDDDLIYSNTSSWNYLDPLSGAKGDFNYVRRSPSQVISIEYAFVRIGQQYVSAPPAGYVTVSNDYRDAFRISTFNTLDIHAATYQSADLYFNNHDGTLFSNGAFPQSLNIDNYDSAGLFATWKRASDGSSLMASADLTSLVRVNAANTVPEPGSTGLFMLGLAGAGLAVRRGRKAGAAATA